MKKIVWVKKVVAAVVGCLLFSVSGYAQVLEQGELEVTGQVGIVTGINTHASFAASGGKAMNDRVFVLGEFGYIPLGGLTGSGVDLGGHIISFMGGAQYQFSEQRSFIPYAGGALGLVRFTEVDVSSNKFYVSLTGGARYYVKDRWGFKPEFTIFAGDNSFFRFAAGMFYQFGK